MNRPQLILAPGKEKSLQRRHPWLFSGAVRRVEGAPQEGDLVDVCDAHGQWMASGHYQPESIICKILSFDTPQVDEAFFRRRLQSAIAYRASLGLFADSSTNVFRLVHAEGDNLPGLVCDWYNGVLVMQAHSEGMHRLFPMLSRLFADLLGPYHICSIFDKSSATLPAHKLHDSNVTPLPTVSSGAGKLMNKKSLNTISGLLSISSRARRRASLSTNAKIVIWSNPWHATGVFSTVSAIPAVSR